MPLSTPPLIEPALFTEVGSEPIIVAAIHDGHQVREDLLAGMKLHAAGRLREEDPFTGDWTRIAQTRIVGLRSRFEMDLNRPRDQAIYRTPDQSWGLEVWNGGCSEDAWERSLSGYDRFYAELRAVCVEMERKFGRFVVLDLHSYNHRRGGPHAEPADPRDNPDINIGTGTMQRERWGRIVDRVIRELRSFDFPEGRLDVRENVKFRGGHFSRWIHESFPESACAIAIEVKKFFMDEWTGEPRSVTIDAVRDALSAAAGGALEVLGNW